MQGWDVATIVRFPPGARVRPGDMGDGVAKAMYRFQVSPLPLPSQAQADEVADTPELRTVCFHSKQQGLQRVTTNFLFDVAVTVE